MRFLRRFGWISPILVLAACDVTFLSISTDGRLQITVVTNGSSLDTGGYRVRIDGAQAQPVAANGAITLAAISQGPHVVELSGLAENCAVEGENPRTVVVPNGETFSVSFVVMCRPSRSIS
jgi:hypothetical protein